jgi:hypothetical protein
MSNVAEIIRIFCDAYIQVGCTDVFYMGLHATAMRSNVAVISWFIFCDGYI